MRFLLLGDIVGKPGRETVISYLKNVRDKYDLIVANGENAAGGFGITPETAHSILEAGIDIITSGNHIWKKDSIVPMLDCTEPVVLRPANYPASKAGKGYVTRIVAGVSVQVINLHGRVFTEFDGDCPFKTIDRILNETTADVRIIDIHAEATSEKLALAHYVDGRAKIVVGTHTHVQTADENVLPGGTAYLSDLGMCGSSSGVIGMEARCSIGRFISERYSKLVVAKGREIINGLDVTLDEKLAVSGLRRVYEYVGDTERHT